MKYAVTLTRADGKTVLLAADEWIDIEVKAGNKRIAYFTAEEGRHGPAVFIQCEDGPIEMDTE